MCILFVSVSFLSRCKDALIKGIKIGHEVALHCLEHRDIRYLSAEEFSNELKKSKEIIKKELGVEPVGFRFPCFRYKKEHLEALRSNGFIYDSSSYDKKHRNKIIIEDGFYEFATNLSHFLFFRINLSGGGYLRLLPPSFYSAQLSKCIKKNDYYMMYLHPFEIYNGKFPKLKGLNFIQKMYINRNRDKYPEIISNLIDRLKLEGFSFYTMKGYIEQNNG